MVDASTVAAGATLQQGDVDEPRPLTFFSRKFTATERRYSTFGRKLLTALKQMAQFSTFASAGQIYHAVIASCLNEELTILPKKTSIS